MLYYFPGGILLSTAQDERERERERDREDALLFPGAIYCFFISLRNNAFFNRPFECHQHI